MKRIFLNCFPLIFIPFFICLGKENWSDKGKENFLAQNKDTNLIPDFRLDSNQKGRFTGWSGNYKNVKDAPVGMGMYSMEIESGGIANYYITGISGTYLYTLSAWWKMIQINRASATISIAVISKSKLSQLQELLVQNDDEIWTEHSLECILLTKSSDTILVKINVGQSYTPGPRPQTSVYFFDKITLIKDSTELSYTKTKVIENKDSSFILSFKFDKKQKGKFKGWVGSYSIDTEAVEGAVNSISLSPTNHVDYYITGIIGINQYTLKLWSKIDGWLGIPDKIGSITIGLLSHNSILHEKTVFASVFDNANWKEYSGKVILKTQKKDTIIIRLDAGQPNFSIRPPEREKYGNYLFSKISILKTKIL